MLPITFAMIPAVSLSSSFRLCNCKAQKYMMHPWDQIQSIKGKCMQHGMVMPDWSIVLQLTNLRGTGHMRSEERVSSLIRRLPMTAGSMRCPGHSPLPPASNARPFSLACTCIPWFAESLSVDTDANLGAAQVERHPGRCAPQCKQKLRRLQSPSHTW